MTLNKDSANDVKTCSSTSDVDVFKKPTTPVTKAPKRKKILDEETYTHVS